MKTKSTAKYQFPKKTHVTCKWKLLIYFHILFVLKFFFMNSTPIYLTPRMFYNCSFCRRSFISDDLCKFSRYFQRRISQQLKSWSTRRGRVSLYFHTPIGIFKAAVTYRTQEPSSNLWLRNSLTCHAKVES